MSDETKQRVNIQFSIDLSELPSEVSRLFGKSCTHTQDAENLLHEISSNGHTLSVGSLADIDAARLSLTKADLVLDDLQKIIRGYLRMKTEAQAEESTPAPQEAPPRMMTPHPTKNPEFPGHHPFGKRKTGFPEGFDMEKMQAKLQAAVQSIEDSDEEVPNEALAVIRSRMQKAMKVMNDEESTKTDDETV